MVLACAKKPFEDVRVSFEEWPKLKPSTPLGSLPVMEMGGKQFVQGIAISTYFARENGLYGSNNMDGLVIDMIQQLREDLLVAEAKMMFEQDEAKKAELGKKLMEEDYPRVLGFFTKIIKENPAKSGFTVGKKLSLGDIVIHVGTETLWKQNPAFLDKYPEIKALRAKVEGADGLKQYLAKRKDTPF